MSNRSIQNLTTFGFNQLFEETISTFNLPMNKAYELAEEIHEKKFGERRFSNYSSFNRSRSKSLRTK